MKYSALDVAIIFVNLVKENSARCVDWIEYIVDPPFNDARFHPFNEK